MTEKKNVKSVYHAQKCEKIIILNEKCVKKNRIKLEPGSTLSNEHYLHSIFGWIIIVKVQVF